MRCDNDARGAAERLKPRARWSVIAFSVAAGLLLENCHPAEQTPAAQSVTATGSAGTDQPQAADQSPAAACASEDAYRSIRDEIMDHLASTATPERRLFTDRKVDALLRFERPLVEGVNHDTDAVSCVVDLHFNSGPMGMYMELPTGLEAVPGSDAAVRVHYTLRKQADTGAPVTTVAAAEPLAELLFKQYAAANYADFQQANSSVASDQAAAPAASSAQTSPAEPKDQLGASQPSSVTSEANDTAGTGGAPGGDHSR